MNIKLPLKPAVFLSITSLCISSCNNRIIPVGPNNSQLNVSVLADSLEAKLKGHCVGYAFVISSKKDFIVSRMGGEARRSQDAPVRPMSIFEKYSCASVSKTVTAAALLKALSDNSGVGLNSLMWTYLPQHWSFGVGIKTITFRELLKHHSGLRYEVSGVSDGDDYATLKKLISKGIQISDKVNNSYNNRNYALLRLIIPKMTGYDVKVVDGNTATLEADETTQLQQCAAGYRDYCKKMVFDKVGSIYDADLKTASVEPPLYYAFPLNDEKGIDAGDCSLIAGGQGWVMSTSQMAHLFRTIHYTDKILSPSLAQLMTVDSLGYDRTGTADGVEFYWKNGIYVSGNSGYRSLIIGFRNDIQIAIMANSTINLQNSAIEAFEEWYH